MEPAGFPGLSEVEGSLRQPGALGFKRRELRGQAGPATRQSIAVPDSGPPRARLTARRPGEPAGGARIVHHLNFAPTSATERE
jgi:hypothetical protein